METREATTSTDDRHDISTEDGASLRVWFGEWEALIRAVDMDGALSMFSGDVVGFGSSNRLLRGRAELHGRQWSPTWPNIDRFTFLLDELGLVVSSDRRTATAYVPFSSTGYDVTTGAAFDRPGRCTIVLVRAALDEPWRAVHTHFSLVPGTPLRTARPAGLS